ncbi:MAG: hypothetical protein RLY57_576 [Candidatus Parcubacteria bacterium]|jgi:hypothetical protein
MFKQIFVWTAGIFLCLSFALDIRDQFRKHGETFKVVGIYHEQTIACKMYHIVAARKSDNAIFTFDRPSSTLKNGEEFDVVVGFIVPKTAKSPASREE